MNFNESGRPLLKPALSVIVPVYNGDQHLAACLNSITGQTLDALELIVVDDGSSDDSLRIAEEIANADARLRILTLPNGGVARARNAGLRIARGDYVTFVDADDWIADDMYERLLQPTVAFPYDAVSSDLTVEGPAHTQVESYACRAGRYSREDLERDLFPSLLTSPQLTRDWPYRIVTKVYRREHLSTHAVTFPDGLTAAQDFVFSVAAMVRAQSFFYLKGFAPYHYRWNPNSRTRTRLTTAWDNYRRVDVELESVVGELPNREAQLALTELQGDLSWLTYTYKGASLRESRSLRRQIKATLASVDRGRSFELLDTGSMPMGKRVACALMHARMLNSLHLLLMSRTLVEALLRRRSKAGARS